MAYLLKLISRVSRLIYTHRARAFGSAPSPVAYSEEVHQARAEDKPIVALESTIITHGMPYPQNLDTALHVENIIRERGATPATVAILRGQLTVGLTQDQVEYLAKAKDVVKASRRDLAPVAAAQLDGATTVAGTIIAAELADIPVFVTGGIGGVHREGEHTFDVSADLTELGRSRTLVVCSGVKSILDIGKTLEYLETQGVCVCAFGESNEFPAFYTPRSGHCAPHRVQSAQHAARLLNASRALRLSSGIVVAVPVPQKHAMDESIIEDAIRTALEEANKKHIRGKEVTPYILAAVAKATGDIALIKNNAKVGADIAVEFKKLKNAHNLENLSNVGFSKGSEKSSPDSLRRFHTSACVHEKMECGDENDSPVFDTRKNANGDVLVIGGANVDRTYRVTEQHVSLDGSTHACLMDQCGGGVGRNMAEALWRLRGGRARLLTAVGDDADGRYLADIAPGLMLDGCIVRGARTPTYAAVLDARGECLLGLGDMALHRHISPSLVDKNMNILEQAPLVVLDGNVPQPTMDHVLRLCHQLDKPVFFEPTDRRKAIRPLCSKHRITCASPNLVELRAMASFLQSDLVINASTDITEILQLSEIVSQVVDYLIITIGAKGVIIIVPHKVDKQKFTARLYPAQELVSVESVSGAGDCFASGFIHGVLSGFKESACVHIAFETARHTLLSKNNVPTNLAIKCQNIKAHCINL